MTVQFAGGAQEEAPSDTQTPPAREGVSDFTEEQLVRVTAMIARALSAVATSDLSSGVKMYADAYEAYLQTGEVPRAKADQAATTQRSAADRTVGSVRCDEAVADNPHKGDNAAYEQVVKAKAYANCNTIWWDVRPAAHEVRWRLVMNLRDVSGGLGLVGYASWPKTGYRASWYRNSGNDPDDVGTQVFARDCRNGTYQNLIAIFLSLPWPYYLDRGNPVGEDDKTARVTNCPRPLG
ncbi:MAG: hypothetical protein F4Y26_11855 [Gammaproteobacteria bacterium]|nr:hypothetical protein [Gammaproteobacteria bacterium]